MTQFEGFKKNLILSPLLKSYIISLLPLSVELSS
jgi:hypothetical protein